jgi:hypothetical protein
MSFPLVISEVSCSGLKKPSDSCVLKFVAGGEEVTGVDHGSLKTNGIVWDGTYRL